MTKWVLRVGAVVVLVAGALLVSATGLGAGEVGIVIGIILLGLFGLWLFFFIIMKAVEIGVRRGNDRR